MLSRSSGVQLCATPQTATHQAPPSLKLSFQQSLLKYLPEDATATSLILNYFCYTFKTLKTVGKQYIPDRKNDSCHRGYYPIRPVKSVKHLQFKVNCEFFLYYSSSLLFKHCHSQSRIFNIISSNKLVKNVAH